mgnify:CR=1 FL=1
MCIRDRCERDYSGDEIEFMQALDEYKRNNGRMFPTCSEILEVVRSLGYVRQTVLPDGLEPSQVSFEDVVSEIGDGDDCSFGEFVEDTGTESPLKLANIDLLRERIEELLKTLTYREREIIRLRYGLADGYSYTLEEVGRIFKVTRERVRQIEAKAVAKLQNPVRSRYLEGFLAGMPLAAAA